MLLNSSLGSPVCHYCQFTSLQLGGHYYCLSVLSVCAHFAIFSFFFNCWLLITLYRLSDASNRTSMVFKIFITAVKLYRLRKTQGSAD